MRAGKVNLIQTLDASPRHVPRSAGSTKHVHGIIPDHANRAPNNFYKTPEVAIERMLDEENFEGVTWDPSCGDGAFGRVFQRRKLPMRSTDLVDYGYGKSGVDFLTDRPRFEFNNICTNPPFGSDLMKFCVRALDFHKPDKVVFLTRFLWLEGERKLPFWRKHPPARVWLHAKRINVARNGDDWGDGGYGGMVAFAWIVWVRGHRGSTKLGWL